MTGAWREGVDHHYVVLTLTTDTGLKVSFVDPRRFGTVSVMTRAQLDRKIKKLGHDVLGEKWLHVEEFDRLVKRAGDLNVTKFLMDQTWISGVGNYLKAEILYASRISPHRTCSSLNASEVALLSSHCRSIPLASYRNGGATVRTYANFSGERGDFVDHLKVYDKKRDPDGRDVVKETTLDGRTTHWVPSLQI
jgi:formamidopyrimidine-DNA glycosylase